MGVELDLRGDVDVGVVLVELLIEMRVASQKVTLVPLVGVASHEVALVGVALVEVEVVL